MGIHETLVIYGLIGCVVAVALVLREESGAPARQLGLFAAGVVFWPVFAPVLLAGKSAAGPAVAGSELEPRIAAAEQQLLATLGRVEGVAEEVLAPEAMRVKSLAGQMSAMARRVREMDELLATSEFDEGRAQAALADLAARGVAPEDPRTQSVRSRLRNIERLRAMRVTTSEDLERIILKLEDMSAQIKLLKFAGRPDAEVVKMIKDIADSVEGVTEGLLAAG